VDILYVCAYFQVKVHNIYPRKTLTGEKNPANIFLISEYHPTMSMMSLGMPLAQPQRVKATSLEK
jgi:hypothetical protein